MCTYYVDDYRGNLMLSEFREWTMWMMEAGILTYVGLEYHYDKNKDEAKKQRKTRTTKKTTTEPSGMVTSEESVEVSEPMEDKSEKN